MPSRAFLLFGPAAKNGKKQRSNSKFQCPRGHFCFSDPSAKVIMKVEKQKAFQCPRGHFCFSDYGYGARKSAHNVQFQCPRGHFCFSDGVPCPTSFLLSPLVSMPSRAFLLFGHIRVAFVPRGNKKVSMPSRAFLLFGRVKLLPAESADAVCFNALAGIFAFRTL